MLLVGGEVVLNFNKSIMKTVMKYLNLVRKFEEYRLCFFSAGTLQSLGLKSTYFKSLL